MKNTRQRFLLVGSGLCVLILCGAALLVYAILNGRIGSAGYWTGAAFFAGGGFLLTGLCWSEVRRRLG